MSDSKENTASVRMPKWLVDELKDAQYARRKQTGIEPSYGELLAEAWRLGHRAQLSEDGTSVLMKVPADLAPIVLGFLDLLLKYGADGVRDHVRQAMEGGKANAS